MRNVIFTIDDIVQCHKCIVRVYCVINVLEL